MSYSIYNYSKQNDMQNDKKPPNAHLIVETNYGLYFIENGNLDTLLKTTDEGVTVETVYTTLGNIPVAAIYYRRSTETLYLLGDGGAAGSWFYSIDLTDDSASVDGNTTDPFSEGIDFFGKGGAGAPRSANAIKDFPAQDNYVRVTDQFGNSKGLSGDLGDNNTHNMSYWISDGSTYSYFLNEIAGGNVHLYQWEEDTNNFVDLEDCGANTSIPSNRDLCGIAYDDSDYLYFVLDLSGTNTLYTYQISTDTLTNIGEYNISLMIQKNTDPSNDIPFNLEKAFDISLTNNKAKIYQISKGRGHLYAISQLSLSSGDLIVAVTDTYLIIDRTGSGGPVELWKYVDFITYFTGRSKITVRERGAWKADLWVIEDGDLGPFEIFDGLFLKIIGNLSWSGFSGDCSYFSSPDSFNDVDLDDDEWYLGSPDDWNEASVGAITVAGDLDFIDTLFLPNICTCEILEELDNHKNVLALSHNGGASDPYIVHDFPDGDVVSGTREFYIGNDDITKASLYEFYDGNTRIIRVIIYQSKIQHYPNNVLTDTGVVPVNGELNHIKIVFDCSAGVNGEYELYIDEVQIGATHETAASSAHIDKLNIRADTPSHTCYIDAYGESEDDHYAVGDNLTGRAKYGAVIPWVDICERYDGFLDIVASFDNHKNVLRLQDDATGGEDPNYTHNFTQTKANTWEFWIAGSEVTNGRSKYHFREGTTDVARLRLDSDQLDAYYGAAWNKLIDAVDDILYHIKLIIRADDTWDVYVDGVIKVNNEATQNGMTDGVDNFWVEMNDDTTEYCYLDAWGDISESDYYLGRNRIKTKENAVIYEGYARWSDIESPRKIWVDSPAMFDLKNKTSEGSYSGRTDEHISDNLDDFANYITAGTMTAGAALGTLIQKGRKSLKVRINGHAQHDKFIWVIQPDNGQGLFHYNAGTNNSEVIWDETIINRLKAKKIRNVVNQVNLKGAINPATGIPFESTKNNLASQQIYGPQPIYRTFAHLNTQALVDTQCQSILDMEANAPYKYTFNKKIDFEGLLLPSEYMTLSYSPKSIASTTPIISKITFYFRRGMAKYEVVDAVIYTPEMDTILQEIEENTDLIEQISAQAYLISSRIKGIALPASSLRAPGLKPATFISHGIAGAWEFADAIAANEETVSGMINLPKDMDLTVAPTFVLMWSSTTLSSDCYWQLEYVYFSLDEDTTGAAQQTLPLVATGEESSGVAEGLVSSSFTLQIPSSTDIHLHWRIKRRSGEAEDTIADTVELHAIVFLYTADILGTA